MGAPPYMKMFWADYHQDTRHLTRDEHGAYFLLLGEAWNRGGYLPDDDDLLARWTISTPEEWARLKPIVMAYFRPASKGRWRHKRVSEELASYGEVSRKRKTAGKKGGSASRGKQKGNGEANAKLLPTKPEPEPELEDKNPPTPQGGTVNDPTFREAMSAYPAAGTATVSVEAAAEAWDDALALGTVTPASLLAAVMAFASGPYAADGGRPPRFDRWLRKQLWQSVEPARPAPAPEWTGPAALLADLRREMGGHADEALRRSRWDPDRNAIVTNSRAIAGMIQTDAGHILRAKKVEIILEQAA